MIQPSNAFKDNLAQLPAIDGIERIDLVDGNGAVVASIENKPGKQGSLAVYHYLRQAFGALDARAASRCSPSTRPMRATARALTRTSTACSRSRSAAKHYVSTSLLKPECGCEPRVRTSDATRG